MSTPPEIDLSQRRLRIGTRGSPLALAQAEETRRRLAETLGETEAADRIDIVVITTTGDRVRDRPLSDIGGKGLFTKEIEEALAGNAVDIAVHSLKDVPTWMPDGLCLGAVLPREDPRDALITRDRVPSLAALPRGAVVGTSSLRRQAQILGTRPDLRVVPLRGNVDTRLRKLAEGTIDATLLAVAGLRRLGRHTETTVVLDTDEMLPAVAQGAIGLQARVDDAAILALLSRLTCADSAARVDAERALLAALDGSCRTPIAGLATLDGEDLMLDGLVAAPDGSRVVRMSGRAHRSDARGLGDRLGDRLRREFDPAAMA